MEGDLKKLWEYFDTQRGSRSVGTEVLVDAIKSTKVQLSAPLVETLCLRCNNFIDWLPIPAHVAQFIAKLVNKYKPSSILDPWLGSGLLAHVVQEVCRVPQYDGFERNLTTAAFNDLFHQGRINVFSGEPVLLLDESFQQYDAIVSIPPFGLHSEEFPSIELGGEKIKDSYGELIVAKACQKLSGRGIGVFVVTTACMTNEKPNSIRQILPKLGYAILACIELPAGTFAPLTQIPTYLIVVQQKLQPPLFVGEYSSDDKHQTMLLGNFESLKEGRDSSQGRWVPLDEFRGYRVIEAKERGARIAKRMGLRAVPIDELVLENHRTPPKPSTEFEPLPHIPNSVYLPLVGFGPARTSQEDFTGRLKHYAQLVINPELASATFVAGLLNRPIGKAIREQAISSTIIQHLSIQDFLSLEFYLPEKSVQEVSESTLRKIGELHNELNELETKLWNKPANVKAILQTLVKVNHEDRFQDWVETLPFPLASIAWAYHAHLGTEKEKFEKLLLFFEALGEFLAVIHISAFKTIPSMWSGVEKALKAQLEQHHLTFDRATFGTWKTIVEYLTSNVRGMMQSQDETNKEVCFEAYRTKDPAVIEILAGKKISTILGNANQMRNQWKGHVGAISEAQGRKIHAQLFDSFNMLREHFSAVWENYELLLPGETRYKEGIFQYKAKRVMGTRTPFEVLNVSTIEPMDDGSLYIKGIDANRALKLLPFIKVMPSPKSEVNACYFYNRREKEGERFVSYHFETESEIVEIFPEVEAAIANIFSVNT